jgi:hypothetical protein
MKMKTKKTKDYSKEIKDYYISLTKLRILDYDLDTLKGLLKLSNEKSKENFQKFLRQTIDNYEFNFQKAVKEHIASV